MKQIIYIIAIALLVSACTNDGTIKVAYSGPLTGDLAILGNENLKGIELALENHPNIKLIVNDDRFDDKETITQYQQLTKLQNVNYMMTVTYGGILALAETAETDNVILINSVDASEEIANIGKTTFGIGVYDESIGYSVADYLNEKGQKKVGMIVNNADPFTLLVSGAFERRFNGETKIETYDGISETDHRTRLTKLAEYDYIVLYGYEETGRIIKQARELGIKAQFIGIDAAASEAFRENAGNHYQDVLFTYWEGNEENEKYNQVIARYKEKYGKDPENILFLATGYDAASVLAESIQSCGDNADCVQSAISGTKGFQGATGKITIDSDKISRSLKETIHKYEGDKIVPV